jgi:hypothetical protein
VRNNKETSEQDKNRDTNNNNTWNKQNTTKNEWAKLFNKAREKRQEVIQEQQRQQSISIQQSVRKMTNNIPYGDKCEQNKENNFRLYFQNVNGLSIGSTPGNGTASLTI